MNVLIIANECYPLQTGGVGIHVYFATLYLSKRKHKIFMITPILHTEKREIWQHKPGFIKHFIVKTLPFPLGTIPFYLGTLRIALLRIREKIDVIHVHRPDALTLIPAYVIAKLKDIPLVVTAHGSEVRLQKSMLMRALQKLAFLHSHRVTAVSNELRDILISRYHVEPSKISVIPNGYDEELTRKYLNNKVDTSKQIVYVGRLSYPKDPFTLLYAFELIYKVISDVSLCFVGDGELRLLLEQFCRDHRLDKAVLFLGKLSHEKTLETMSRSAIFVLSSHSEGLPTALIEALALGKPVVATRVGGIPEVVKDGINGVLVTSASPRDMAQALLELLTNSQKKEELGRAARESVKCYAWSKIAEEYETMYEKILSLKKTRI